MISRSVIQSITAFMKCYEYVLSFGEGIPDSLNTDVVSAYYQIKEKYTG